MDSNHRRQEPADLQSAPFGHSGNHPRLSLGSGCKGKGFRRQQRIIIRVFASFNNYECRAESPLKRVSACGSTQRRREKEDAHHDLENFQKLLCSAPLRAINPARTSFSLIFACSQPSGRLPVSAPPHAINPARTSFSLIFACSQPSGRLPVSAPPREKEEARALREL